MSSNQFDPTTYNGKDITYVKITGYEGICRIWTWNREKLKYVKRDSGNRFYAYKMVAGVQRQKCFETCDSAKTWRETAGLIYDSQAPESEMLFKEATRKFFERMRPKLQISTFETYESNAKHLWFFDSLPVNHIGPKTIDAWLAEVKKPEYLKLQHDSRFSYRHELSVLGRILDYYAEYEDDSYQVPIKQRHKEDCIVDFVRYHLSKDRNQTQFIPYADLRLWLNELEARSEANPANRVFHVLGECQAGSGPRIGELCAIDVDDVNLQTGEVRIAGTVQWSRKKGRPTCVSPLTKTGKSRVIFLNERSLQVLRNWLRQTGRIKGLIFSIDGTTPIPYRAVQHHYDAAFKTLGMKWKSTHILRHSYATDFLEKTGDKQALQGQLGHSSSRQTDHYAKITATAIRAGVKAYDQALRGANVVDFVRPDGQEKIEGLGVSGSKGSSKRKNP